MTPPRVFHKLGYAIENGRFIIEIRLQSVRQIFDPKDPSPLRTKDLEESVDEYIVISAEEIGRKKLGKIIFYFTEEAPKDLGSQDDLKKAIHNFFAYRSQIFNREINKKLTEGLKAFFIGLICLSIALFVSFSIEHYADGILSRFLVEGTIILSWVSMWRPLNIFLYEWWPLIEDRRLMDVLKEIDIDFISDSQI